MKGNRAIVTAVVVVVVLLLGWYLFGARAIPGRSISWTEFDQATKKPDSATFPVIEATLGKETKKAIATARRGRHPADLEGPRARRRLAAGESGAEAGSVGEAGRRGPVHGAVSDGKASDQLFNQHVDPFNNPADRQLDSGDGRSLRLRRRAGRADFQHLRQPARGPGQHRTTTYRCGERQRS